MFVHCYDTRFDASTMFRATRSSQILRTIFAFLNCEQGRVRMKCVS
jgi:hypothetical protein